MKNCPARRGFVRLLPSLAFLTVISGTLAPIAQPAWAQVIPGDYIVLLKSAQDPAAVAATHGLVRLHTYSHAVNGFAASIPAARLRALADDPRVAVVEPDQTVRLNSQTIPTGISRIGATRSSVAKIDGVDDRVDADIAILDTGIDLTHPDLNVVSGVSFVKKDRSNGSDVHGHGTHVAGIAAALDNDFGVVGMAPGARLWAVKVLDDTGAGTISSVVSGIDYVVQNAGQIEAINMSWILSGTNNSLRLALQSCVSNGVVCVAGAGNSAQDVYGADGVFNTADDQIPAAYPEVITVSALSDFDGLPGGLNSLIGVDGCTDDRLATFSNHGRKVDLAAPGVGIYSTVPLALGGYATFSGTSMAAPHVVGAVALYIAKYGRAHDAAGVEAIRRALIAAGEPQSAWGPADTGDPDGTPEPLVNVADVTGRPPNYPPVVSFTAPTAGTSLSGDVAVNVSATGSLAVTNVEWYLGGTLMGSSSAAPCSFFWDTTASTNGLYTLQARAYDAANNMGTNSLTVAVQNLVARPTAPGVTPATRCGPGNLTLGATGSGGTLKWYSDAGLTTQVGTGASFTTPLLSASTTYYVTETSAEGSASSAASVTATVNAIPAAPGVTAAARCGSGIVTLGATGSGGTLTWYSDAGLTTQIGTGASFATPSLGVSTTYYVTETSAAGCVSAAKSVTATINAAPGAPGVSAATRCGAGSVTLGATGSGGTLKWYSDPGLMTQVGTGTSFTTPSLSVSTTYYVTETSTGGCVSATSPVTATINTGPAAPVVTPATRCGAGSVTLGATGSGGTLKWYSDAGLTTQAGTGTSFTTPSLSVSTTYYVTETSTGGCVSTASLVTATLNAGPAAPGVTPAARCGSGSVTLGATGSGGTLKWYSDAGLTTPVGTGASFTTPSLSVSTTYYVTETSAAGCVSTASPVTATLNVGPAAPGVTAANRCGSGSVTLGATGSGGTLKWYSDAGLTTQVGTGTSFTTPSLSVSRTYYVTETSAGGCVSATSPVTATINAGPAAPGVTSATRCSPGTVTLGATGNGGTLKWYSDAGLTAQVGTGASFTTPSLSVSTTYYVTETSTGGCVSTASPVTATLNAGPTAPGVTPAARCSPGTVTLGATGSGGTLKWYSDAGLTAQVGTGASFTTPSLSVSTTYYVTETSTGGCVSAASPVTATINTGPAAPGVTPATRCGPGSVTLGATGSGGSLKWYSNAGLTTQVGTGASFTTPSLSVSTTYYVTETSTGGCVSAASPVTATINTGPAAPGVTLATRCGAGSVTLGATGSGGTLKWYSDAGLTTQAGTGTSFTTLSLSVSTTYYVTETSTGGCVSVASPVTATINAGLAAPGVTPATRCGPGSVTLGATGSGGTLKWYSNAGLTTQVGTGASFTTPSLSVSTTYYVTETSTGGCVSAASPVTATINTGPAAPGVTPATRCGAGSVTLGATGSGGTLKWYSNAGLTTQAGTGASFTTPSLSVSTTYYVTETSTGGCVSAASPATATINTGPAAPGVTPATRCGAGSVTLGATGSGGTLKWYSDAGLTTQVGTGASFTTPSLSVSTTYYVTETSTGGCVSAASPVTATIDTGPAVPGVTPATRCGPGSVTLGATGSGGTLKWFSDAGLTTQAGTGASFTTPSLSVSTTYYVTETSTGGCVSAASPATATINAGPAAPGVAPANRCGPGSVTLGATGSGGTFKWYSDAGLTPQVGTGASFTTPSLSVSATYYVTETSTAGCVSAASPVTATINAAPAAPVVTPAARCGPGSVTLGATGSGGTLKWYSDAGLTPQVGTGASFTTPSLSVSTTYYVTETSTAGCVSAASPVTATINTAPAAPGVTAAARCGPGSVTLGATGSGGTFKWYADAGLTPQVGTGASFTTPSLSVSATYYVTETSTAGCVSAASPVTATINAAPAAPVVTPAARCGPGSVTLGATGSGGTLKWYSDAGLTPQVGTGASFTTPSLSVSTTYYVTETSTGGCVSAASPVTATINAASAVPGVTPATRCGPGSATLGATGSGGTLKWYSNAGLTTQVGTGASFTTPSLSVSTTYYVTETSTGGCVSATTPVTATINAPPAAPGVAPGNRCGAGSVTLGATGSGGTLKWYSDAGLTAQVGTGASFTAPSQSASTTYYVTETSAAGCVSVASPVTATINAAPAAPGVTPVARCSPGTVTLSATGSGGTLKWYSDAGLTTQVGTGASFTTPSLSLSTTYYVTETSAGGCVSAANPVTATINAGPAAPGVTPAARCGSGTVTLGATGSGGTLKWYSDAGLTMQVGTGASFTTPSLSVSTTYYVTETSVAGCISTASPVTATIDVIPEAPEVTPAARCGPGSVTLGATGSGGTFTWYSDAGLTTAVGTGENFTTPSLSTSTIYYVTDISAEGCASPATPVTATINADPVALVVKMTRSPGDGATLSGSQSGAEVLVSWPATFTGYTLYSASSLQTASWTSEGTGTVIGDQFWVTNALSGTIKFYRLQK